MASTGLSDEEKGEAETNPFAADTSEVPSVMQANEQGSERQEKVDLNPAPTEATTLDEPITETLMRDVRRVGKNIMAVLAPGAGRDPKTAMREWDLWGPLLATLAIGVILSFGDAEAFPVAFALIAAGSVALTANVVLLGGKIIFLQSLSLLGYCVFPLVIAASICLAWGNPFFHIAIVVPLGVWSSYASVPFVAGAVSSERRILAAYPVRRLLLLLCSWPGAPSEMASCSSCR